jgi:hypothetical protein
MLFIPVKKGKVKEKPQMRMGASRRIKRIVEIWRTA